jgi:hypothetical protein
MVLLLFFCVILMFASSLVRRSAPTYVERTQITRNTNASCICNLSGYSLVIRQLHCSSYANDQSKLYLEVANRLHNRDCSAWTQYTPLHPFRLTGKIFPAADTLPDLPVGTTDRFESIETRFHTFFKPNNIILRTFDDDFN